MKSNLLYQVHSKEKSYFLIKILAALIGYGLLFLMFYGLLISGSAATFIPMLIYVVLILLYLFFRMGVLTGYLKGNSILLSQQQFPEVYQIVAKQSNTLGLREIPAVYILQNGGLLNAFASRFFGTNFIVIYSDVFEEAFENNIEALKFIIGHELGHIKRMHMTKNMWLFPSAFFPFLNSAYSRACEYTCDNIGASFSPEGARSGLLLLASGKKLWRKVNIEAFLDQETYSGGFWFWFSEKVSSHPRFTKRIGRLTEVASVNQSLNYDLLNSQPVLN